MIIVVAAIAAVLSVPLTGRSLAPLAGLSLRRSWLIALALCTQVIITVVAGIPNWLGESLHVVTFGLAAGFVWANRRLPGMVLIAVGGGLNLLAIAANGGSMPASASAWRRAGLATDVDQFENSHVIRHARLPWLGDLFAVPKGWPLANVFSVGDVVIVIAIACFLHVWCRRSSAPAGDPATAPPLVTAG